MSDVPPGADKLVSEPSVPVASKPETIIGTNTVAAQKRQGFLARVSGFFHKQEQESNIGQIVNRDTGEVRIVRKGAEPGGFPKPPTDAEVKAAELDMGEGLPIMWARYGAQINEWLKTASLRDGPAQGRQTLEQLRSMAGRPVGNGGDSRLADMMAKAASFLQKAVKGDANGADN